MDLPPFAGASALIFGGAKGIGKCVALEWARRGARLAIADLAQEAAQETATEIEAMGGKAIAIVANVMSDDSVAAAADAAEAALGPVDIVMNNVGGMLNGHPEDIPMAEWQRIMELNYFAAVRGVTHFLPKFIARGRGHIVSTASFAGLYPYAASRVPYGAAKAAVISMSQNLAVYCEPMGIRVSCLIPGPVMTQVMDSMTSWTEDCPLRGPGKETTLLTPEHVANVLSDGMRDGRILIPSDPVGFEIVQRWAADPDGFIRARIAEFASGDRGNPVIPPEILGAMEADAMSDPRGRLGVEMLTLLGMPPVDYVKLAGAAGCSEISTGLTGLPLAMFGITDFAPWPEWSLRDDPALRREMKAAMADSGVSIGLAEGFSASAQRDVSAFEADLDIMAGLGALRLNAICMEGDMAMAKDQLAKLANMAIARGMLFTIEFFPCDGINSLGRAMEVIGHIGVGKAHLLLDTMHLFRTGSSVADVKALPAGTIAYVQLADSMAGPPEEDYFMRAMFSRMVPGTGELPLRELLAVLDGEVTISLEVPRLDDLRGGMPPAEHLARCVAAARELEA